MADEELLQLSPIEPIKIDGLGMAVAKIDTGNDGHNVLSADPDSIIIVNNKVFFRTINNVIKSSPIVDTISVHIGAGNVQERPVIELDIWIRDKIFKNTRFSLADRSQNEQPVLIGKPFMTKVNAAVILTDETNG